MLQNFVEQLRIHPDDRFEVFVVFDPVKGSCVARNRLLEPVQRRIDFIRLVGFFFLYFLLWEKCRTTNIVTVSGCCKPKPEAMQLNEYGQHIALRHFLHNHGNIATEGGPKSGDYLTLIEWLQGFFIVHSIIDNTAHSTVYAQPRGHTSDPAGIRNQYFWVSSHNWTEWAIGAGQYYIASSLHLLEYVFW